MDTVIADLAQYGFLLSFVLALVVWLGLPARQKAEVLVAGVIGGVVCLVLIKVAGAVYFDPRPFVADHVAPLFPHAADNGFPSDHTAVTLLVGFCMLVVSRRWGLVLVVLSLLAGAARVLAHVHSPVDILGAVAIAAVAAALGWLVAPWVVRRLLAPRWPALAGSPGPPASS
jgi:membrane-associated phospholipid phosphatase